MGIVERMVKELERSYQTGEIPYGEYSNVKEFLRDSFTSGKVWVQVISQTVPIRQSQPYVAKVKKSNKDNVEIVMDYYNLPMKAGRGLITIRGRVCTEIGSILKVNGCHKTRKSESGTNYYIVTEDGELDLIGSTQRQEVVDAVRDAVLKNDSRYLDKKWIESPLSKTAHEMLS